jgi:hypothetical protein
MEDQELQVQLHHLVAASLSVFVTVTSASTGSLASVVCCRVRLLQLSGCIAQVVAEGIEWPSTEA